MYNLLKELINKRKFWISCLIPLIDNMSLPWESEIPDNHQSHPLSNVYKKARYIFGIDEN